MSPVRYPIRATLVKMTSQDGLMEMHDHMVLGTVYWILGPGKIEPWQHVPTGRIVNRLTVPVQRAVTRVQPGVELRMPFEMLAVADPQDAAALVLDSVRRP